MNTWHGVVFAAVLALGACSDSSGSPDRSQGAAGPPGTGPEDALLTASVEENGVSPPAGREVRCRIASDHSDDFAGPCIFTADSGGSFSLSLPDEAPILDGVVMVSVHVEDGAADVRGLTTEGINSRWGRASRQQADPACWRGADFEVCAWA